MSLTAPRKAPDTLESSASKLRFMFHFYDLRQKAGIQRAICELSNALVDDGHEVFVVSATGRREVTYPLDSRVSVIAVAHPEPSGFGPSAWPLRAAWAVRQWRYISRMVKEIEPSVLVDHGTALGLLYPFRKMAGIPFVMQRHFPIAAFPNGRAMHRLLYYLKRRAVIVVVAEGAAAEFRSYGYRNIHVIPGTVPARAVPAEYPQKTPRVGLLIGRAVPQKGFDLFLNALALKTIPGWQFMIVGPGVDQNAELRNLVEKHSLQNTVSLLPATDKPYEYIARASCVIMPSRYEGLPLVALESLAIGRPLIAAAVDGLRDVVIDGVNGRLFPSENIQKLSECLASTCGDEAALAKYAKNAGGSIERFRAKNVIEAWKDLATNKAPLSARRLE